MHNPTCLGLVKTQICAQFKLKCLEGIKKLYLFPGYNFLFILEANLWNKVNDEIIKRVFLIS